MCIRDSPPISPGGVYGRLRLLAPKTASSYTPRRPPERKRKKLLKARLKLGVRLQAVTALQSLIAA
eukprot:4496709-Alexandrium_andersonii.AAC.1